MSTLRSAPPAIGQALLVGVCVQEDGPREQVCEVLEAGGHTVVAQAATVEGLLAAVDGSAPACVVVASERPDRAAISEVQLLRSQLDGVAGVLVCRRARGLEIRRALELGIDGVLLVEELEDALVPVVSVVCAGQVSLPSAQRGQVRAAALTRREKQILALVIAGLTNAEIAGKLYLAESTVKSHLSSAFSKLGVSSRHEAASLILDPERGRGLGIPLVRAEPIALQA